MKYNLHNIKSSPLKVWFSGIYYIHNRVHPPLCRVPERSPKPGAVAPLPCPSLSNHQSSFCLRGFARSRHVLGMESCPMRPLTGFCHRASRDPSGSLRRLLLERRSPPRGCVAPHCEGTPGAAHAFRAAWTCALFRSRPLRTVPAGAPRFLSLGFVPGSGIAGHLSSLGSDRRLDLSGPAHPAASPRPAHCLLGDDSTSHTQGQAAECRVSFSEARSGPLEATPRGDSGSKDPVWIGAESCLQNPLPPSVPRGRWPTSNTSRHSSFSVSADLAFPAQPTVKPARP